MCAALSPLNCSGGETEQDESELSTFTTPQEAAEPSVLQAEGRGEGAKQTGGEYHRQECEEGGGAAAAVGAAELRWVEEQMGDTRQGRMNSGQKKVRAERDRQHVRRTLLPLSLPRSPPPPLSLWPLGLPSPILKSALLSGCSHQVANIRAFTLRGVGAGVRAALCAAGPPVNRSGLRTNRRNRKYI